MERLAIYVDTSVFGGCLDEEFQKESQLFLDMVRRGEVTIIVSDILARELELAPSNVKEHLEEFLFSIPPSSVREVQTTPEAERLQREYLAAGAVGPSASDDAMHVATATTAGADMIVSWNFKHIVNFFRIRAFNAVNTRMGYPPIDIRSPSEVIKYEEE